MAWKMNLGVLHILIKTHKAKDIISQKSFVKVYSTPSAGDFYFHRYKMHDFRKLTGARFLGYHIFGLMCLY